MNELPKALTEVQRDLLKDSYAGLAALAWIDAATELLAEQAAQIVADWAEYRRMQLAVIAADEMHQKHVARIAELEARLNGH